MGTWLNGESFYHALAQKEKWYMPATVYKLEGNSLVRTNRAAVALQRVWCWITGKEFKEEAFDKVKIAKAIGSIFNSVQNKEIIKNIGKFAERLHGKKDVLLDEKIVRAWRTLDSILRLHQP